jgi:hypothetical protein
MGVVSAMSANATIPSPGRPGANLMKIKTNLRAGAGKKKGGKKKK